MVLEVRSFSVPYALPIVDRPLYGGLHEFLGSRDRGFGTVPEPVQNTHNACWHLRLLLQVKY